MITFRAAGMELRFFKVKASKNILFNIWDMFKGRLYRPTKVPPKTLPPQSKTQIKIDFHK